MGEYATYKGQQVKIGTCEDMYYLRADQMEAVTPLDGNVNPVDDADALRFRFPFPDEDTTEPGGFASYDRFVAVWGIQPPDSIEHNHVQFSAPAGYLLSLPCPESPAGKAHAVTRNGFRGPVLIQQQRYVGGKWVLICACGGCGAKYRLPTLVDARPVIDALRTTAIHERARGDDSRATFYDTIADRIEKGYEVAA